MSQPSSAPLATDGKPLRLRGSDAAEKDGPARRCPGPGRRALGPLKSNSAQPHDASGITSSHKTLCASNHAQPFNDGTSSHTLSDECNLLGGTTLNNVCKFSFGFLPRWRVTSLRDLGAASRRCACPMRPRHTREEPSSCLEVTRGRRQVDWHGRSAKGNRLLELMLYLDRQFAFMQRVAH